MKNKIFIAFLLVFCIIACAPKRSEKELTLALAGETETLDPALSYDGITHGVLLNVYDTIIRFKGSSINEFEPLIASQVPSVENGLISKDGLVYTFPIRQDIKFADGTPLTVEDTVYSLRRFLLTDTSGGPSALLLEPILDLSSTRDEKGNLQITFDDLKNAIYADGNNLIVKLKKPFAPFLAIMARWSYIINKNWAISQGTWDGSAETMKEFNNPQKQNSALFDKANGSGPFIIERWDKPKKRIYLKANKNYFLGAPKLDRVYIITLAEQSTMRLMLQSGEIDIAEIAPSLTPQLEGDKNVKVYDTLPRLKTDPVLFFTFKINPENNPDIGSGKLDGKGIPPDFFEDKTLRQAFAYAFDYDAFLNQTMRGKAPRACGPVPPKLLQNPAPQKCYDLDLEKSKKLFKTAKNGKVWDKGFSFTLTVNSGSNLRKSAAEILKRNVEGINPKFKIEIREIPWANFLEKTQNHKMPLWVRGWVADYPDAHNFAFPFLHHNGRYAIAQNYNNPEITKLIEQAKIETSPKKRAELYSDLQALNHEEATQIYTVYSPGVWVLRSEVKGFLDNPVFLGIYLYPLYK
ncbi:MAG: ABC transporter substrate-binding protein [Elusimicrobiaceae bacterium]|nr:ABC transporter substrate-binding protein [Elusimicrobiaceae bacterium]